MGIDPLLTLRLWQLVAWIVLYFSVCPLVSAAGYVFVGIETVTQGDSEKFLIVASAFLLMGFILLAVVLLAIAIGFPFTQKWLRRVRKPLAWIVLVLIGTIVTGSLLFSFIYGVGSLSGAPPLDTEQFLFVVFSSAPSFLYLVMAFGLAVRTLRKEGRREIRLQTSLIGGGNDEQ